jgi:rhodanese-related sulfurtransferase
MYKGDLSPTETWQKLQDDPKAVLIDVRTDAEWAFVGIPAIEGLVRIPWQVFPTMQRNESFTADIETAGITKDQSLLFICRSGQRSAAAAALLTQAGYTDCYNVAEGFEGNKDTSGHRGTVGGWKHAGLPWVQS